MSTSKSKRLFRRSRYISEHASHQFLLLAGHGKVAHGSVYNASLVSTMLVVARFGYKTRLALKCLYLWTCESQLVETIQSTGRLKREGGYFLYCMPSMAMSIALPGSLVLAFRASGSETVQSMGSK